MRVAIIGAGIAGLACARRLRDAGLEATLFDKSRGIGGRLATRRAEPGDPGVAFDHGATHFTARSEGFTRLVAAWEKAGLAARWPVAGADSWVGTPTMTAPLKTLADDLDVRLSRPVTALTRSRTGWTLHSEARRLGKFDTAVIAIPDEKWSERPLACVAFKPGQSATPDELNTLLLEQHFAKWQLPERYEVIDAVPRTSTGKFYKLKLREQFPA